MNLVISQQEYYEDILCKNLIEKLNESNVLSEDSIVYYRYPAIVDFDDKVIEPSVLIVDKKIGVFIIECDSSTDNDALSEKLSCLNEIESNILSKLMRSTSKNMKKERGRLCFNVSSLAIFPNASFLHNDFNFPIEKDTDGAIEFLSKHISDEISKETIGEIQSLVEGSRVIIKPKERLINDENKTSKAYILKKMEEQMAVLDMEQKKAALSLLNGPQRIRGLAGSGKTIILCMKAAYLHLIHPEYKILYTFTTKSLYDYIERTITRVYKYLGNGDLPNFDMIQIKHAWGGINVKGVYYDTSITNGYIPIGFSDVKSVIRSNKNVFDFVCQNLLEKSSGVLKKEYDYVLIDEAQDFKPSFYQLCRAIVKNDCLVWCYDDLQNIFDVQIQDTIATFENKYGAEGIDLVELKKAHEDIENDIVLDKTYRNPREVLVVAHGIGFGIYNENVIQKIESNSIWEQFGYTVEKGNCKTGSHMVISRDKGKSPLFISEVQNPEQIIIKKSFGGMLEELEWVASEIEKNIKEDLLKPDDIVVISLDDINSKSQFAILTVLLDHKGINSYNLSSNNYLKGFIKDNAVTLTTLYKAKGNEAGIVYVISADVFEKQVNSRLMRNKVFTAFTRTKGWLRITGVNCENSKLYTEIQKIIDKKFKFEFNQPEEAYALKNYKKKKGNNIDKLNDIIMKLEEVGVNQDDLMELLLKNQLLDD